MLGGVVLVVVVEFDNAGPASLDVTANTTAPAMIRPDEHVAATIFHVIAVLRSGSVARRTLHVRHDAGTCWVQRLLGPLPSRRRAGGVVLQFFTGTWVSRCRIGAAGEQDKTRLSVG